MTAPAEIVLRLTLPEAQALLALAAKGRVFLDVDPAFLAAHARRAAAGAAVARLRTSVRLATPAGAPA